MATLTWTCCCYSWCDAHRKQEMVLLEYLTDNAARQMMSTYLPTVLHRVPHPPSIPSWVMPHHAPLPHPSTPDTVSPGSSQYHCKRLYIMHILQKSRLVSRQVCWAKLPLITSSAGHLGPPSHWPLWTEHYLLLLVLGPSLFQPVVHSCGVEERPANG